jgi:hypothetical protein
MVVPTSGSDEALVCSEETVETADGGPLAGPVAGSLSSLIYGSESSEPKSGKESESVRVTSQLLEKIPSVSDGARLVFGGIWGSVWIGGSTVFCFRLLLLGVNTESIGDCLEDVSIISFRMGLTVLQDDLRPEEHRCFLCFRDDLCFLVFRWVFSLSSSSKSCKCFLLGRSFVFLKLPGVL